MKILNCQRRIRVPVRSLEQFLAHALRRLELRRDCLSLALVNDAAIARWNRLYRKKKRPTDVLSFPAADSKPRSKRAARRRRVPGSLNGYLGDIAVAPAVARRNARRFGRTSEEEMKILILHGILHLMGYDHETDSGQMERLERRLRRELGLS